MSVSIRELSLRAVAAALAASGTPATGGVFRSRMDTIEQTELPCFDISPGEEKVADPGEYGDTGSVTRTLPVHVRSIIDASAQSTQTAPDDSALDPFYVFVIQQLTGGSANLGGAVLGISERGGPVVFQPAGRDLIGLEQVFDLTFATKRGDPTRKG